MTSWIKKPLYTHSTDDFSFLFSTAKGTRFLECPLFDTTLSSHQKRQMRHIATR